MVSKFESFIENFDNDENIKKSKIYSNIDMQEALMDFSQKLRKDTKFFKSFLKKNLKINSNSVEDYEDKVLIEKNRNKIKN